MSSICSAPVILCFKGFGIVSFYLRASASEIGSPLFFFRACRLTSRGSLASGSLTSFSIAASSFGFNTPDFLACLTTTDLVSLTSLPGYGLSAIISDDSFNTSEVVSDSGFTVFCFGFFAATTGFGGSLGFSDGVYFFVSSLGGSVIKTTSSLPFARCLIDFGKLKPLFLASNSERL